MYAAPEFEVNPMNALCGNCRKMLKHLKLIAARIQPVDVKNLYMYYNTMTLG